MRFGCRLLRNRLGRYTRSVRRNESFDLADKLFRVDRLGDVAVEAGAQQFVAIADHGQRGDRDQRYTPKGRMALQPSGDAKAIDLGQLDVANDKIDIRPSRRVEAFLAV